MNGLYIIIIFFLILHISIIIGLFLDREKVKKILRFLGSIFVEIIYELGKTLFLTGIVGVYFIHEDKDFTKALYGGIIFFIIGYGLKYIKENK
jgi:hypothetical protein